MPAKLTQAEFRILDNDKKRDPAVKQGRQLLRGLSIFDFSSVQMMAPDIPTPSDIKVDALGSNAFFAILPVSAIGAESRNGWKFGEAAVKSIVDQINSKRPEGGWGHIPMFELSTKYDPPAVRWLAAMLDPNGVAWAKVIPLTDEARNYYHMADLTNARVGDSIVAWAKVDDDETILELDLMTIDLADPARVGVPLTAHPVKIVRQMDDSSIEIEEVPNGGDGAQDDRDQGVETSEREQDASGTSESSSATEGDAEDSSAVTEESEQSEEAEQSGASTEVEETEEETMDPKKEQKNESENPQVPSSDVLRQRDNLQAQVTQMKPAQEQFKAVADLFGATVVEGKEAEVTALVTAFRTEYTNLIDTAIGFYTQDQCKVPSVWPIIKELARARTPKTSAEAQAAVAEVIKQDHVQRMIASQAIQDQGPAHRRNGGKDETPRYFNIPKSAQQ